MTASIQSGLAGQQASSDAAQTRKTAFIALGAVVFLGLAAYGIYEMLAGASETTDDAYVVGDVVAITARQAGTVVAIRADNTESVTRGQPLIELDPSVVDASFDAAKAELARSVRAVRSSFSRVEASGAEVLSAEAELSRARDDLARREQAAAEGAVSGEEVAHAADTVRTAQASLDLARSRRAEALSAVEGTDVRNNPDVLAAIAALQRAAIGQSHMHISAPTNGVVAQRTVQLGQHVAAGTPLMAVVPLDRVWVEANFRETQLADIRVGQPVTITSDVYGSKVVFHGQVLGLGAGSGSAFALLPAQNASGNWIKIVQRVPVRISLDRQELRKHPLRIGLSMKVEVDTTDNRGTSVARAAVSNPDHQTDIDGNPDITALVESIIAANEGRTGVREGARP
jgi:membrane fusion protein (multidrug efflux system)